MIVLPYRSFLDVGCVGCFAGFEVLHSIAFDLSDEVEKIAKHENAGTALHIVSGVALVGVNP